MADPISGLDMVREIIGQINNLRKLITIGGKQYRLDEKTKTYKADGKTFTRAQLRAKLEGQSYTAPKLDKKSKLKINKTKSKAKQTKTTGGKSPDPWKGSYKTPKSDNLKIREKIQKLTNKAKNTKDSIPTKKKGFYERYGVTQKDVQNVKTTGKNKDGTYKMSKATRATVNQRNYGRKNAVLAILGKAADRATDQLVDRGARQIAGKSKMTLEEFRKARDAGELKGTLKKRLKIKSTNKTDNKKTNNKKTNTTTSSKSQLDQNIDKAKGWNKRQLQKKKDYQSKFGKLSNIPEKEGNATIKNRDGIGERINPDFGKKPNLTVKSKKKSGSKYPAKIGGKKTSAIQKKLIDAGFTAKQLAEKMRKHKEWKAARGRR